MTTFRSDDGREIDEADVLTMVNITVWSDAVQRAHDRLLAALAPKPAPTCLAYGGTMPDGRVRVCSKDRGHTDSHTYEFGLVEPDPVHWASWREPNG